MGDTFTATVKLDTEGQNINAVDITLSYPPLVHVKSVSKSGSIIQLWVQDPSSTDSAVFFTGGIPGGFSGVGVIGKITVSVQAIGDGAFNLSPGSSVLLNDGQGSMASLALTGSLFTIKPLKEATPSTTAPTPTPKKGEKVTPTPTSTAISTPTPKPSESVVSEEKKDHSKPQTFEIMIGKDPRVFQGKNFVSFFTTDSDSGVDHYEFKEGSGSYKIARSPYLLSDQSLHSVLRVRAYDSAGNYRETTYPGIFRRMWWSVLKLFRR